MFIDKIRSTVGLCYSYITVGVGYLYQGRVLYPMTIVIKLQLATYGFSKAEQGFKLNC